VVERAEEEREGEVKAAAEPARREAIASFIVK